MNFTRLVERPRLLGLAALGLAVAANACGAPEGPGPAPRAPLRVELAAEAPATPPPPYVLVDPDALPRGHAAALEDGAIGVVLDGMRAVVTPHGSSVARELTSPPLVSVAPIPAWLGGGFLFQTGTSLYRSGAFDGSLEPLAALPSNAEGVAFGPTGVFVRGASGERWAIDLPSGARAAPAPLGVVDFVAAGDGRAAAIVAAGGAFVSTDRGARWIDVTRSLRSAAAAVVLAGDAPAFQLASGRVMRLEESGKLTEFAASPSAEAKRFREKDPRWRATEPPLRAAIERGVALDDHSALVAMKGDVARVDLQTGALVHVSAGCLPPELACEAMRAGDTWLFVCAADGRPAIVASMAGVDGAPEIEKTFAEKGLFYASDNGSLAYRGSCAGDPGAVAVCVRDERGVWSELTLTSDREPVRDGGPASSNAIARWIPSGDGGAVGVSVTPVLETVNPRTGKRRPIHDASPPNAVLAPLLRSISARATDAHRLVDRSWSTTSHGTLRGWTDTGQTVEIENDGSVRISAYTFPRVASSGLFALASSSDGRAFQTTDAGSTWVEVAPPPTSTSPAFFAPHACSSVGCDLGAWARIGWDPSAPGALSPPFVAAQPAILDGPLPVDLTCVAAGELKITQLPPTPDSPEDFGFGASRLPASKDFDDHSIVYERHAFSRTPVNPAHGVANEDGAVPRVMVHGYLVQAVPAYDDKGNYKLLVDVLGPRRGAGSFERKMTFVAPFDPQAAIRTVSFGPSAFANAGKDVSLEAIVAATGGFEVTGMIPVTPLDPGAANGYLFEISGDPLDLLGVVVPRAAPSVKIGWPHPRRRSIVSAIEVDKDAMAILAESEGGADSVYKVGKTGITDLGELTAPSSGDAYPANPDAIAVGPQDALGILRTPSGAEPPSSVDPALLIPLGGRPIALAPWSTLTRADDPACRADANGYRATIQATAPWVRLLGAGSGESDPTTMLARVRWSETRVCLEAVETREAVKEQPSGEMQETWVVAKFTAPAAAGRLTIGPGMERRQALTCSLGAAKPAEP